MHLKRDDVGCGEEKFYENFKSFPSLQNLADLFACWTEYQIMDKSVVAQNPVNRWIMNRYEIKSSADADADVKG